MKTLIIALLAFTVGCAGLLPEVAEAKRFGGGKSLGQQYSAPRQAPPRQNPQRQAQPAQQPGQQGAAAQGANRSGASRWLGPLAGLAAGGLLAAMLFGDGFQGFQVLDFVIIALLVFGGFLLVRTLRRRAANHGPLPVGASANPSTGGRITPADDAYARAGGVGRAAAFDPVAAAAPAGMDATGADEAPPWFDAGGFVEGARAHFIRLQAAWDQNQMDEIASYTAPALFEELRLERARLDGAENSTEVVRLAADLLGVRRDGEQAVASVRFTGLIREDAAAPAVAMDETWHVAHAWDNPAGDWRIVGIQQNGA